MKIFVGKKTPGHKGDTSRELVQIWKENNLCEVIEGQTEDYFLWANNPGEILLYEYARWDSFPFLPQSWKFALFGNMQHKNGHPWIFWGRRPKMLYEKSINNKKYEDRDIDSIFLGKIENGIQKNNRTTHDWSTVIQKFSMPIQMGDSLKWPYSQEEYLELVANSRFGLALPGYGPKCNREIEYLALGVVPLISEAVDLSYHDPLIKGKHYLTVRSPEDVKAQINNCSKSQWEYMSHNCKKWYQDNASPVGSFRTTERIISSII